VSWAEAHLAEADAARAAYDARVAAAAAGQARAAGGHPVTARPCALAAGAGNYGGPGGPPLLAAGPNAGWPDRPWSHPAQASPRPAGARARQLSGHPGAPESQPCAPRRFGSHRYRERGARV